MSHDEGRLHFAAHQGLRKLFREVGNVLIRLSRVEGVMPELDTRFTILESQMENVLARLDGHDLGFATMALDEEGKERLGLLVGHRTTEPAEEGTSES